MHTSANAEIELIDEQFIRLLYKSSIGRIIRIYSANDSCKNLFPFPCSEDEKY